MGPRTAARRRAQVRRSAGSPVALCEAAGRATAWRARDARRVRAMRIGQGRARPVRQQWLGTAARSTRTAAMQGPEEMGGEGLVPLAGGLLVVAGT